VNEPAWSVDLSFEDSSDVILGATEWRHVLRAARESESGNLVAKRAGGAAVLTLDFGGSHAILHYRQGGEGSWLYPTFPHRRPPPGLPKEQLCSGCGIWLGSWDEFLSSVGIRRADAFALAQAILRTGKLPAEVPESPHPQLVFPGMEAFLVPDGEWRAVEWRPWQEEGNRVTSDIRGEPSAAPDRPRD
jgi:hypothetical protein